MTLTADDIRIRDAGQEDMPSIHEIYAEQVLHGIASWELDPPSLAEMTARRVAILDAGYPYRVAVRDGRVIGYAYASAYRPRPAYRHTVENSIYIAGPARRSGVGKRLLADLIDACAARNFRQMIAVIGDSGNAMSIEFHRQMGFREIGTIRSIGFKFDRWLDSVIMQRDLGDGDTSPPT